VFLCQKKAQKGPLVVVWDIVGKCNVRCTFCNWWRDESDDLSLRGKELPLDAKLSIIRKLADAGVWMLSFCGGESLLCQDLDKLIVEAKKRGMLVSISTNGLLLEEKSDMLVRAGTDFITISMDSHDPDIHDAMRGYKGLFDKVEKGLRKIRETSKDEGFPHVEVRCLINKKNYLSLDEYVAYWREKVDGIIFKPIYSNPHVFFDVPVELAFCKDDEDKFRQYFSRFLLKNKALNTEYMRCIPDFLFTPERLEGKFLCFAGTFFAGVDALGRLRACSELSVCSNKPLGNLVYDDFVELWNSPDMSQIRSVFKQGKRCRCWMDKFSLSIPIQRMLPFFVSK